MEINKKLIIAFLAIVIIGGAAYVYSKSGMPPTGKTVRQSGELPFSTLANLSGCELPAEASGAIVNYDNFAKCLTEKGVKMYGAYWCSHCQNQKKAFGDSFKYVTYIECADPNSQGQLEVCTKAGITGYPTWEFSEKK